MKNTGHYNTGDYNTGNRNTGDYNTGNRNTGYRNTGDYNTGHCNTGNSNTGHYNIGNNNTGNNNTGNNNTGDCNTNSPTVRIFNHDSGWKFYSEEHLEFRSIIGKYQKLKCVWVFEKDMSKDEKKENPSYKTTGGYLKVNDSTYNGKEVSKEDEEFLRSVPNFCPDILEQTTGIILKQTKTIVIDGKSFEISKESFDEFKKQFK